MSTPTVNPTVYINRPSTVHIHGASGSRRAQRYGTLNHETPPDTNKGPPPPYVDSNPTPGPSPLHTVHWTPVRDEDSESVRESDTLLGTKRRDKNRSSRSIVLLFFVLMLLAMWSIVPIMSVAIEMQTEEWQRVHKAMVLDIGKLREEKRAITNEVQALQIERDAMRRKWENEREANEQRRRSHLPFWSEPRLMTAQCPKDRFRRYEARMYNLLVEDDWYARCMNEPIEIAGRKFTSPASCLNYGLDQGVRGYWTFEVNSRECPRTIWDRLRNIFR